MADTRIVSDRPLTLDSDLDLDHGNLNFVRDTPSHGQTDGRCDFNMPPE